MTLPSGLPEDVDGSEELARFLYTDRQIKGGNVAAAAFMPHPVDLETSVSRRAHCTDSDLCAIGRSRRSGANLHGVALVSAGDVRMCSIDVEAAEPPDFHAVLLSWPVVSGDPVATKAMQMEKAVTIASKAAVIAA